MTQVQLQTATKTTLDFANTFACQNGAEDFVTISWLSSLNIIEKRGLILP